MSDFNTGWQGLNSDPRFRVLSYEDQQKLRAQWLQRNLTNAEGFNDLTPGAQTVAFQRMVTQAPTFTEQSDYIDATMSTARGVQAGDPQALRTASAQIAGFLATNNAGGIYKLASSIGERVLGEEATIAPIQGGSDRDKAVKYLEQQFRNSDEKTFWQSALVGIAPMLGIVANISSGRVAAQAPLAATREIGQTGLLFNRSSSAAQAAQKVTQGITGSMGSSLAAQATTRFGRWVGRSALPEMFEAGVDASMIAAGDYLGNRLKENAPFGIDAGNDWKQAATNFGIDFVGDMVFFGTANVLGAMVKVGLKTVRWRGFKSKVAKSISEEAFDEVNDALLSGRDIRGEVWSTLPKDTQATILRMRRAYAIAKNLPDASPDEIARATALRHGYDMVPDGGGVKLQAIGSNDYVPGVYTNERKALLALFEYDTRPPEQMARTMDAMLNNEVGMSRVARFQFGDDLPMFDEQTIARTFTPSAGGQMRPEPIRTAVQSTLQRAGADASVVRKVDVKAVPSDAYWKMGDNARVQGSRIIVPDVVRTADDMARFMNRFSTDVVKLVPDGGAATRLGRYVNDALSAAPKVETPTNPMFIEAEALRNNVAFQAMPNGTWRVGDEVVGSLQEAGESVHRQSLFRSEQNIRDAFGNQYGFVFDQAEDGRWVARGKQADKGGNLFTGTHETLEGAATELWEKGFQPRMSQNSAANVIITPDGSGVEIVGKGEAVTGPIEYIRDYAKQYFPKFDEAQILRTYRGGDYIAKGTVDEVYRVTSPTWGVIKEFSGSDAFKEANTFLSKQRNSIEELLEIGLLKGVPDIQINGGRIVARSVDGPAVDFDSIDELRNWLKARTPSPTWTKEMSNMDQATLDSVWEQIDPELRSLYMNRSGLPSSSSYGKVLDHMKDSETWRVGGGAPASDVYRKGTAYTYAGVGLGRFIKDFLQTPTYARVRRTVGETGRDVLGQSFEAMEKSLKNSRAMQAQASELLHGITQFEGAPKRARRIKLRPFLEVDPTEWQVKAKKWNIDLNDKDIQFMNRYRKASDTFGQAYGIDPYRMISYHLPRIRDFMRNNKDIVSGASRAREVLGKMDARMPRELEFFSAHLRAEELSTFVNTADPMDLLSSYTRKGVKDMTMGKTYEELMRKWNQLVADSEVTAVEKDTMFHYLESMMGMYSDEATKAAEHSAREAGRILSSRLGAKDGTGALKDWINMLHGLTISATMSFRPWPVIRNMQQVWTTLAPMFGNDSVFRAMKVLGDEKQSSVVHKRLQSSGRLQDRIPIYGGVYEATGKLGFANKVGMKIYGHSDDYTRMMVDVVVRDTLTDAVAKFDAGIVNEKQFIRLANLHRLDDFDQREVVKRLRGFTDESGKQIAGSFETATDYYGDIVTRETMFAYTAGSNPMAFNGMWGRLFGIFGHYPVYYAQTLFNGLRRGNLMDKAVFAGRVAANSAALWFTFEQVFGVRADDFMPHKTMFFSGGPYFKLLSDALAAAAGDPGSSFERIIEDAKRLFIPGSGQLRNVIEGVRLMSEGDVYEGFLRVNSAPLADD